MKGEVHMFKKFLTGVLLLAVSVLVLGACSSEPAEEAKSDKKKEIVATVNGEGILKEDYEEQLESTKATYQQQGMNVEDLDSEAKKEMEQSVLDQLINVEVLLQTAKDKVEPIPQSEVDSELENVKSQFQDNKQYKAALKENKLTEEKLKVQLKEQLMMTKYIDSSIGEITVSDEEVKSVYEQYKQQLESQKQKPENFEAVKPQLEQQAIAQKKEEKLAKLIEDLRKSNEENIEVLI
ncbi:MAG TPA: hypothetical protein DCR24_03405 [Bacillus bacterium]|nr:hypothetical protein [Bacillus sp. (in: firmicutes)]